MPDLLEVIKTATAEATDAAADAAADAVVETPIETPSEPVVAATSETPVEPGAGTPPAEPVDDADDIDQELDALGIKPPIEGQRENRIPYSRVQKILKNAFKKQKTNWETEKQQVTTKLTEAERRLSTMDAADQLANSDPEKYLQLLATLNPGYQRFLQPATAVAEAKVEAAPVSEPKPEPDGKFPDGSTGYTPEGFQKYVEWNNRQLRKEIDAEYSKRFKPIEEARQAAEAEAESTRQYNARIPIVKSQIARAQKRYGEKLFNDNETEVLKVYREHPDWTLPEAAAEVLLPLIQVDQNKIREKVLKEINERPEAAARAVPAAAAAEGATTGERTLEEVIRGAVVKAGLLRV